MFNDHKIPSVVLATPCGKHHKKVGQPCYILYPSSKSDGLLVGICGRRIKAHGFNGKVSQASLELKRQQRDKAPTNRKK